MKRIIDISISSGLLFIFLPLLILISITNILLNKGKFLFVQNRSGRKGIVFKIMKFKTMNDNINEKEELLSDGERLTIFGRFLRSSSLDELPTLWNVLVGHMSLVGPRPERPHFVEKFRSTVPGYMLRHKMKSGITGWAQVSGWRGDTSLEKRIEFDLFYIENWSVGFDLKILWLTLWKSFLDKNAY